MHFVDGDRIVREALQLDTPEEHPAYWDAVSCPINTCIFIITILIN